MPQIILERSVARSSKLFMTHALNSFIAADSVCLNYMLTTRALLLFKWYSEGYVGENNCY
jgi:hypothetical protein